MILSYKIDQWQSPHKMEVLIALSGGSTVNCPIWMWSWYPSQICEIKGYRRCGWITHEVICDIHSDILMAVLIIPGAAGMVPLEVVNLGEVHLQQVLRRASSPTTFPLQGCTSHPGRWVSLASSPLALIIVMEELRCFLNLGPACTWDSLKQKLLYRKPWPNLQSTPPMPSVRSKTSSEETPDKCIPRTYECTPQNFETSCLTVPHLHSNDCAFWSQQPRGVCKL